MSQMQEDFIEFDHGQDGKAQQKIRGIKCTAFKQDHQISKLNHKAQLGTINPVHKYKDPRKDKDQISLEPIVSQFPIHPENRNNKALIPDHLTQPYMYIQNTKVKQHSENIVYQHRDIWNKSHNLDQIRQQRQIPKLIVTELTQSCNPAILEQAKQVKNPEQQRKIIYSATQKIKEDIFEFFTNVYDCLQKSDKKFTIKKWFDIYQRTKRLGFQIFKTKPKTLEKQFERYKQKKLEQSQNEDSINDPNLEDPYERENKMLNDPIYLSKHDFTEFILNLGFLKKKIPEINRFFDYCVQGEDIDFISQNIPEQNDEGESLKEEEEQYMEDKNAEEMYNRARSRNKNSRSQQSSQGDSVIFNSGVQTFQAFHKGDGKQRFSMRSFLYNFTRFEKEQKKVSFVLSDRSAHERTITFKKKIEHYEENYPELKQQLNDQRDFEDECLFNLQEMVAKFDEPNINSLYRQAQLKEHEIKSSHKTTKEEREAMAVQLREINMKLEHEMEIYQKKYDSVKSRFEQLIQERDTIFFNRRILIKNIKPLVQNHLQSIPNPEIIKKIVIKMYDYVNEFERILDQMHNDFLNEKKTFKEDQFKLFEIATFIYDCGYKKNEIDIITSMINKVKGNYNISKGLPKDSYIDPNEYISLEFLTKTFQIQKDQAQQELNYLGDIYDQINEDVESKKKQLRDQVDNMKVCERVYKKPETSNQQIEKIMEKNTVLVFLERLWAKYDRQFKTINIQILEILKYIQQNQGQDNLFVNAREKIAEVLQEDYELVLDTKDGGKRKSKFGSITKRNSNVNSSISKENNNKETDNYDLTILNMNSGKEKSGVKFDNTVNDFQNQKNQQAQNTVFDNDKDISSFLNNNNNLVKSQYH